ncbi:MAG TPA: ATPase [Clostridiales bacterium]|nr:ATPase [Clostridiales bacterium]
MTLTKSGYRSRIIDNQLGKYLHIFGAVCIEGPKWCGKTWAALNQANSVYFVANPENNFQNRTLAQLSPDLVLPGESPRLIDEWQEVPSLWDAVRFTVDQTQKRGQFILTGSATTNRKGILHSGTGRIARLMMRPMSLFESGDSNGSISLERLFTSPLKPALCNELSLQGLIALTVRGGWPGSFGLDDSAAADVPKEYLRSVLEDDIRRIDGKERDIRKMTLLLRSLARNESTVVANRTLQRDMLEKDGEPIGDDTVADYLDVLRKLFIIEDQQAYDPNLRSSIRVGKSAKRHFIDPSLAAATLGASPERLLNDLNTYGFMFEAMCIRDLKIYADSFGAQVFHYRDDSGREIDAVIELPDGRWGAFEIKLGANQVDDAARDLLAIRKLMAESPKSKAPELLGVICGLGKAGYIRADGVMVIPITALKP